MKSIKYFAALAILLCFDRSTFALEYFRETIHLLNDDGTPLAGVEIRASSVTGWVPGRDFGTDIKDEQASTTDRDGIARFQIQKGNGLISYSISGNETVYGQRWERNATDISDKPSTVYAKARVDPVSMFVRRIGNFFPFWPKDLPTRETDCSFDLLTGDWLPPYGEGHTSDIVFRWVSKKPFRSLSESFDITLEVSFPGRGNGITKAVSKEPGPTNMPLERFAPIEGYSQILNLRMWREGDGRIQSTIGDVSDWNQGYFFRIRTVLDASENISKARYGKIIGALSFSPRADGKTHLDYWYFVSGVDNDRNMEHRQDTNLFNDSDSAGRRRDR